MGLTFAWIAVGVYFLIGVTFAIMMYFKGELDNSSLILTPYLSDSQIRVLLCVLLVPFWVIAISIKVNRK